MTFDSNSDRRIIENSEVNSDEIDLSKLLGALWRGKFLIAFTAIIGLALGAWYSFGVAVPVYTAKAKVALESRQDQVVDIESVVTGLGGDQATINTEVEVFQSRGLAEKLVKKLDLVADPEFNGTLREPAKFSVSKIIGLVRSVVTSEDPEVVLLTERQIMDSVIDVLLSKVTISNVRQSYVFQVTAVTQDPERSATIANTLAELYILEQLESKFAATEQATTWLTDRVGELQIALETAEAEVKDFNASAELVSPEALAGLNRQIKDLRDRLRETESSKEAFEQRANQLQKIAETGDLEAIAAVANDPTLGRILQLIQKSGQTDPDRSTFDTRVEQIQARAQLEVARAQQQIDALRTSITEQERQIEAQSADLVQLQQLQREAEASRLIYEFFLGRLKETSVQEGIQRSDSRMLSRAVVPRGPSAPNKSRILALSLILGTFFGAAIILIREMSQTTFRDASDLEAMTGYTVVGQIPLIPARRRKNVLKYLSDKPTSAAAEAIRNLRTSVLLSNIDNPPQIIMSTSSIPGEGKTTQSLALAKNLTGLGKRVLLVEGDIRRRVFTEYFSIDAPAGVLSVLSGNVELSDAVITIPELGADILFGEKSITNAADIFSSRRFAQFLDEARKEYDYIIIDTPPVLAVPDARIIGQIVDAIIYTVKWDSTSHRQVREGIKSFEDVNIRIAGLCLSQINPRGMKRYGYGDSYGAYNAYYDN